jgi:hypothetical protein
MKKIIAPQFAVLAVALLLSACAGGSMIRVTKPEIDGVKKLAIVSVYSNSELYNVGGGGQLTALVSMIAKKSGNKGLALSGTKLVDHALDAFTAELGKVKGWVVLPSQAMLESPAYKAFAESFTASQSGAAGAVTGFAYSAPKGMITANMVNLKSSPQYLQQFGKLCSDLNVDAVAVIHLDVAYAPYTAVMGSGTAKASVAADVKVINREGKFVAMTPDIEKGKGMRLLSDDKAGMVADELVYSDAVEKMFLEAVSKNAVYYAEELNKQL